MSRSRLLCASLLLGVVASPARADFRVFEENAPGEREERSEEAEEVGLDDGLAFEGPVAIAESIPPAGQPGKHVVHVVFAADLGERSLDGAVSSDAAVRGHRLFHPADLDGLVMHPPIQRFLQEWRPGDPCRSLGGLWQP